MNTLLHIAGPEAQGWCAFFAEPPTPKAAWGGRRYRADELRAINGVNAYYSIAAFPPAAAARDKASALGACVVLCDDVGPKASEAVVLTLLGEPSFKIQTSEASQQWGYLLDRIVTDAEMKPIHDRLVELGLCDASGNNLVRYGRLPAGINNKADYPKPFTVACKYWNPKQRFDPAKIIEALNTAATTTAQSEPEPQQSGSEKADRYKQQILSGATFHEPLLRLAGRYIARGNTDDEAAFILQGLMNRSAARGTARWQERYDEIPRDVVTARQKFDTKGPPQNILSEATVAPFTADEVPAALSAFAIEWSRSAGFDPSSTLGVAVVAAAAMLTDAIKLEVAANTRWEESGRLWVALIGSPGLAKTPSIKAMMAPVDDLHRELVDAYDRDMDGWEASKEQPKPPPRPAMKTNDATTEKLCEILVDNPRGILYRAEELDSWLGAHDAYRSGGSKDRGLWLQLFDGGQYQVDRIIRGSSFVPNLGASLVSATTPARLRLLAKKLPNDGLLQRFVPIMVAPAGTPDPTVITEHLRTAYAKTLRALYGHRADVLAPSHVRMSAAAEAAFHAENNRYRQLALSCAAFSEPLAGHVNKYGQLLARVALIFHAVTEPKVHPAQREVSEATINLAARFMRKVFLHARVLYRDIGGADEAFDIAQRVGRWILAGAMSVVRRADVIRAQPHFRRAGELVQGQAMQLLVEFGWLTELDGAYKKAHVTRWLVDEKIRVLFAAQGEAHRQAVAQVRAAIRGEAPDE